MRRGGIAAKHRQASGATKAAVASSSYPLPRCRRLLSTSAYGPLAEYGAGPSEPIGVQRRVCPVVGKSCECVFGIRRLGLCGPLDALRGEFALFASGVHEKSP